MYGTNPFIRTTPPLFSHRRHPYFLYKMHVRKWKKNESYHIEHYVEKLTYYVRTYLTIIF